MHLVPFNNYRSVLKLKVKCLILLPAIFIVHFLTTFTFQMLVKGLPVRTAIFSHKCRQQALFNVLKAYAVYNPEIGYCQGMGFISALLLMYMAEEVFLFPCQIFFFKAKSTLLGRLFRSHKFV